MEVRVLRDELIDIRPADELLEPHTALVQHLQGVRADPRRGASGSVALEERTELVHVLHVR